MSFDLPPQIRAALDRLAEGRPRAELARRAAALSEGYRAGGGSAAIAADDDALAYALARLPATYAATAAALAALEQAWPAFAPDSSLDVGAGPATATLAAAERFFSLRRADLVDRNPRLRELAGALIAASGRPALAEASYELGDAVAALAKMPAADLVLAGYVIGELPPAGLAAVADALWARTRGALVVVEPGTPAGFSRIAALRARLIAAGAHVAAPCPHAFACPIVAPDWCHFARRLARSRDHRLVKGAEVPFEDEKFAYVALTRLVPARGDAPSRRDAPLQSDARVLAPPQVTKIAVGAKLCTAEGTIATASAPHRDKAAYKAAKGWRWGDAVTRPAKPRGE
jgi:ribosomal protein RSM22 (predicted rRNA methylase)